MPRNSSGTHTLPAGQPVVPGTTISAATHNALAGDLSAELTDSLSRSGKGGMSAPLRTPDGTKAAPAHAFNSETGSGLYRAGAGDVRVAVLGVDALDLANTGVTVPGTLDVTGEMTIDADVTLGAAGNQTFTKTTGDIVLNAAEAGHALAIQQAGATQWLMDADGNWSGIATNKVVNLATPTASGDAATKGYVDGPAPTAMSLVNGFTGSPAYWKDASGVVHLTGRLIQGGAGGTTQFTTLPAGYRPSVELRFPVARGDSTLTVVIISSTGDSRVVTLGGGEIDFLDGISFRP